MRSLFLWILAAVIFLSYAAVLVPILWLRPQNLIHRAARSWSLLVCRLAGVRVQVERPTDDPRAESAGRKNQANHPVGNASESPIGNPLRDPLVVISNHLSLFDMVVMYCVLPDLQFRWLAKASLFKIPIWGWGMWGAGYIPVKRDNPANARESMQAAAEHVRGGKSVIVFAEGTRGPGGGRMLPFKKGGFVLAKRAGVPIQPMTILDSDKIIPPKKKRWIQPIHKGVIRVILHKQLRPAEIEKLSTEELRETLRTTIGAPLNS
ncbi:MAG: 1-acyl-sn-glycerol-3-phosphate acyltransferase [bacterium]|nr:1-acyl-sn-glycerol-3-phosphate acyltransferase [bacterium]